MRVILMIAGAMAMSHWSVAEPLQVRRTYTTNVYAGPDGTPLHSVVIQTDTLYFRAGRTGRSNFVATVATTNLFRAPLPAPLTP